MGKLSTNNIVIQCTGVKKCFGDLVAVDDINMTLQKGEILFLLGPSGCGKTTILRMIAGLEKPDAGLIKMGERTLSTAREQVPPEARNIGIVFQDYALFPHMTVQKNVLYGLHNHPEPKSRAQKVLNLVGLTGLESRMPHELSGGEQQRVALARALAPRPEVILFDEPFSNLDAGLRSRLRTEIRRILKESATSAIFVTHDQEEALSIADRVAVVCNGKILQTDTPQTVYSYPATREVATMVGEANILPGKLYGQRVSSELGILELDQTAWDKLGWTAKANGGQQVELMIRPENLELCTDDQGKAEVVDREYFGHHQLVHVQLESGTLISIRLPTDRVFDPGSRVTVRIKGTPRSIRLMHSKSSDNNPHCLEESKIDKRSGKHCILLGKQSFAEIKLPITFFVC